MAHAFYLPLISSDAVSIKAIHLPKMVCILQKPTYDVEQFLSLACLLSFILNGCFTHIIGNEAVFSCFIKKRHSGCHRRLCSIWSISYITFLCAWVAWMACISGVCFTSKFIDKCQFPWQTNRTFKLCPFSITHWSLYFSTFTIFNCHTIFKSATNNTQVDCGIRI